MSETIDPAAVVAELGWPEPVSIAPVSGGFGDTKNWRLEIEDREPATYALRVHPSDQEWMMRRELAFMKYVAGERLPVPHVHASGMIQNRPAMLVEWCRGRTLTEQLMLRPDRAWSLGRLMGRMQGRLNLLGFSEDAVRTGRDWIGWVGDGESRIQERLHEAVADEYHRDTIIHLDFHPSNLLVQSERITGIIDWANAAVGDTCADFARTDTILRYAPRPPVMKTPAAKLVMRLFHNAWRTEYLRHVSVELHRPLYDAWALAVMWRDLSEKLGRPNLGYDEGDLGPIRTALARRKKQLGLA